MCVCVYRFYMWCFWLYHLWNCTGWYCVIVHFFWWFFGIISLHFYGYAPFMVFLWGSWRGWWGHCYLRTYRRDPLRSVIRFGGWWAFLLVSWVWNSIVCCNWWCFEFPTDFCTSGVYVWLFFFVVGIWNFGFIWSMLWETFVIWLIFWGILFHLVYFWGTFGIMELSCSHMPIFSRDVLSIYRNCFTGPLVTFFEWPQLLWWPSIAHVRILVNRVCVGLLQRAWWVYWLFFRSSIFPR